MLYVGFGITGDMALKLFDVDDLRSDTEKFKFIDKKLASVGLVLVHIRKGVCILGSEVEQIHIHAAEYLSVDDGLRCILDAKKKVTTGIEKLQLDMSDFEIQKMEEDPIRVSRPEPYLISV